VDKEERFAQLMPLDCVPVHMRACVCVCVCVCELSSASWKLRYSWRCQLVNYSDDPDELRVSGQCVTRTTL